MRGRGLGAVAIGALVFALGVAGCGGSGDDATADTQIAKAVFLKKGNAICLQNLEEVKKDYTKFIEDKGGPEAAFDDLDSITEYVDTVVIPNKEQMVEDLRELGAPSGDEDKVDAILEAYEEGIEVAEEDPERAGVGSGVFWYAADLTKDYKLTNCRT